MAMNNMNRFSSGEIEHGVGDGAKREPGIAPFVTKTYDMVEDPNTNSVICWSSSGSSFVISDHNRFSFELLPKYFKHTNMSSFVYQLNNYVSYRVYTFLISSCAFFSLLLIRIR